MFKVTPDPTFPFTVMIPIPGGDPAELKLHGRRLTRSQIGAAYEAGTTFDALVKDNVVGWDGVDAPFSAESLAALLENYPLAAQRIALGFVEAQTAAKSGN